MYEPRETQPILEQDSCVYANQMLPSRALKRAPLEDDQQQTHSAANLVLHDFISRVEKKVYLTRLERIAVFQWAIEPMPKQRHIYGVSHTVYMCKCVCIYTIYVYVYIILYTIS